MDSRVAIVFYMSLVGVRRNRRTWRAKKVNMTEYGRVVGTFWTHRAQPFTRAVAMSERTIDPVVPMLNRAVNKQRTKPVLRWLLNDIN